MAGHDDVRPSRRRVRRAVVLVALATAVIVFRNRKIAQSESNLTR
ncbi:MAG TPA: hypothetical protein VGJ03_07050 [Acidimicrobiales bacterium]|jgi:hypothetical protein